LQVGIQTIKDQCGTFDPSKNCVKTLVKPTPFPLQVALLVTKVVSEKAKSKGFSKQGQKCVGTQNPAILLMIRLNFFFRYHFH
jgi:hypothetical protein